MWYIRKVTTNFGCLSITVLFLAIVISILGLALSGLPTFEDPFLGFEARGSELSNRASAWVNVQRNTGYHGILSLYPETPANDRSGRKISKRESPYSLGRTSIKTSMCRYPTTDHAHVILKSTSGSNLFSLEGLKAICDFDRNQLRKSNYFPQYCEYTPRGNNCCASWSIANYVASIRGLSNCKYIRKSDIKHVLQLLAFCKNYYHDSKLTFNCVMDPTLCHDVPMQCKENDGVYHILHYMADAGFLHPDFPYDSFDLTYTTIFLPIAGNSRALEYYKDLENFNLSNNIVEVTAMEFGLKNDLFGIALKEDLVYVGLAVVLIFLCLWLYTSSFFVTFMTFCSVLLSLGTAYFVYSLVYRIEFFPFINLFTIFILIGIGADDACTYAKVWASTKAKKTDTTTIVHLALETFSHAGLSMFVKSLTTAVALFSGYFSHITTLRCFSIFGGTAVLANLFFAITWIPATVVASDQLHTICSLLPTLQLGARISSICAACKKFQNCCSKCLPYLFENLSRVIVRGRYFWMVYVCLLFCVIIAFAKPIFKLSNSEQLQLFESEHLFERYDMVLKRYFWYGREKEQDTYKLPIRIVWGVVPVDTGNYLDPHSGGKLLFDSSFNMATPEAQIWMYNFCIQLRNQSFYQPTSGPLMYNCIISTFKDWMGRRCKDGFLNVDRSPCCESAEFPYSEEVFNYCIRVAAIQLHRTPGFYGSTTNPGTWFSKDTGNVKVFSVQYDSIYSYSDSYTKMNRFYNDVNGWVKTMLETAPENLRNGWFTSDLEFYDLEDSLLTGLTISTVSALFGTFLVVLFATLDLVTSILTIITITLIYVTALAFLVLLGWEIGIIEIITFNLALGLAAGLTIQYGVAYINSSKQSRKSKVRCAISKIGSSVAMSAFTTMVAGGMLLPSIVLVYKQIGIFLIILTSVSWIYATFFFLPCLSLVGPLKMSVHLNKHRLYTYEQSETAPVPEQNIYLPLAESTLSLESSSVHKQDIHYLTDSTVSFDCDANSSETYV